MIAAALVLSVTLGALPTGDAAGSSESLRRVYEGARLAMVQVGSEASGSGVVISENGLIVTAAALAKGHDTVPITFTNGYTANARVVATSDAVGVALLRLDGLPAMAYVRTASAGPHPNQVSYGFALARTQTPSINFARVASTQVVRDDQIDERLFTVHYGFRPRSIGGAVLSWDGQMLGVVLANDTAGTSFCASTTAMLAFIGEQSENLPTTELSVDTDPAGAIVLVDGDPVGHTPLHDTALLAGSHTVILRAEGLPDTVRTFTALGKGHQHLQAELFPGASLAVRTLEQAEIWVDGIRRGQGSTTLWLPSGRHWIGVVLRGHHDFGRWVEVVEDRPLALVAELPAEHATLSVATTPSGAEVVIDDNHLGVTPLEKVPLEPGTYELTLTARGYHAARIPVVVHDGQDVDLGKVRLDAPRTTLRSQAPEGTELSIDGQDQHALSRSGDVVAPGQHQVTYFAPYQYRSTLAVGGEDGQVVEAKPAFVPAGDPDDQATYTRLGLVTSGAGAVVAVVAGVAFIAAELDRNSNKSLSSRGHTAIGIGLASGGISLGLFAGGAFINSLQPTPEMGWTSDPPR